MAHMFGGTVDVHDPTFGTTGGRVPLRFYSSKLLNHAAAINAEARVLEAAIKTDEARQAIPDLLNKFREQLVSLPTFDDLVTTSQLRITEVKGILSQVRRCRLFLQPSLISSRSGTVSDRSRGSSTRRRPARGGRGRGGATRGR